MYIPWLNFLTADLLFEDVTFSQQLSSAVGVLGANIMKSKTGFVGR